MKDKIAMITNSNFFFSFGSCKCMWFFFYIWWMLAMELWHVSYACIRLYGSFYCHESLTACCLVCHHLFGFCFVCLFVCFFLTYFMYIQSHITTRKIQKTNEIKMKMKITSKCATLRLWNLKLLYSLTWIEVRLFHFQFVLEKNEKKNTFKLSVRFLHFEMKKKRIKNK